MRLEGQHHGGQPGLPATLLQHGEYRLMPEVQPVEIADGDDASAIRVTAGFEAASNQHDPAGSEKPVGGIIVISGRAGAGR